MDRASILFALSTMKKEYRVTFGTKLIFILFGTPLLIFAFYLLFISKDASLFNKVISAVFIFLGIWGLPALLTFKLTIDDEYISTRDITPFPGPVRFRWDEIEWLHASGGFPFQEGGGIIIKSKHYKRKFIFIPIGAGLPYEIIKDILPHLSKNASVKIEPFLMKYIEGKARFYQRHQLIIVVLLLLLLFVSILIFGLRIRHQNRIGKPNQLQSNFN